MTLPEYTIVLGGVCGGILLGIVLVRLGRKKPSKVYKHYITKVPAELVIDEEAEA